jgi:hypothetical protein
LDRAAQTERVMRAAGNPFVTIIGHMTGHQTETGGLSVPERGSAVSGSQPLGRQLRTGSCRSIVPF